MARAASRKRMGWLTAIAWLIGFLMFFPILWTLITALKTESDAYRMNESWQWNVFTTPWTLENFGIVQNRSDYLTYLKNTLIIAGFSSVLGLILAIPAAWSMAFAPVSKPQNNWNGWTWLGLIFGTALVAGLILYFSLAWDLTGQPWIGLALLIIVIIPVGYWVWTRPTGDTLLWMLSTKMMPPAGALIPIYLIFNRNGLVFKDWSNPSYWGGHNFCEPHTWLCDALDWRDWTIIDTFWGMVPLMTMLNLPIIIWMLYTYFKEIPHEILESSRMDGASLWSEITRILIPVAMPGIVSTMLLNLILSWNEAFWSLNLTNKYAAPLSFMISEYSSPEGQFWAKLSAASIMAITPILVVGWFSQRQLVRGLTFGAVK